MYLIVYVLNWTVHGNFQYGKGVIRSLTKIYFWHQRITIYGRDRFKVARLAQAFSLFNSFENTKNIAATIALLGKLLLVMQILLESLTLVFSHLPKHY